MDLRTVFGFLVLCGLGLNSYAADDCVKGLERGSVTIELDSPEQPGDMLVWKKGGVTVYHRRKGSVTVKGTVNNKGGLVLNNLNKSMAGEYKAEHHGADGKLIKKTAQKLCVLSKTAPVPKVKVTCSTLGETTLKCEYKAIQGFTVSWFNNSKELSYKTNSAKFKNEHTGKYRCRLTNSQLKEDKEDSDEETFTCTDDTLFGFNKWIMYGIIGGGGFLLLVLIILLIVLSCKSHRRRKRRQRDVEEMRLQNMQYIGSMPRRPKHSALGQPVPPTPDEQGYLNAPEPGDPGFGNGIGTGPGGNMEFDRGGVTPVEPQTQTQTQTQPRRQARPRAPPPPAEEDEEVAPPLPQPRRTGHQRPRP